MTNDKLADEGSNLLARLRQLGTTFPPQPTQEAADFIEKALAALRAEPATEAVRDALENLVSLLLQTMEPIGPMRDRSDYPPELQTAITALKVKAASPERSQSGAVERKPCPLCGRVDPHSHTSGPLGIS